jgi:hypothetical protein
MVTWNLISIRLETTPVQRYVLDLHQMCHRLIKSFWMHPMVLVGVVAQVDARFGPFKDSANLDKRLVHGFC